jgi:hypothetical protein
MNIWRTSVHVTMIARRVLCIGAATLGLLSVPAQAFPPTAQLVPTFVGGKPGTGTSIHLALTAPFTASDPSEMSWHAVVHLPLGTSLNFARLPHRALCNQDVLAEPAYGLKACPKASHVGPPGRGQAERLVGSAPTFANVPISPVIVGSQDGTAAIALYFDVPVPPFEEPWTTLMQNFKDPTRPGGQELVISPLEEVSSLSVALGGNAAISGRSTPLVVMPKTCPKGGFRWRIDYSAAIQPERSTATTSPCPGGRTATAASRGLHMPIAKPAQAAPKTAFQCEKRFESSQGRAGCFSQLPGASCAHPLEAQMADNTVRGEHRYFRLGFHGDPYFGPPQGDELHYSYAPASRNVAMCPYPTGAVYTDSLESDTEHCEGRRHNGHVEEYCGSEYDIRTYPEPVRRSGGSFTFDLKAPRSGYLVVKGYFIHPPWEASLH